MVGQLASNDDMKDLQKAFKVLDTNNDGMLSRKELMVGFKKIYGDGADIEVSKIFEAIDVDGSG